MTLHKSDAIILKRDRSGESSLLVELFIKNEGRMNLLAKGARKPSSVLVGKLEPYSEIQILYYKKNEESLGMISQVTQLHTNSDLNGDIRRISYGSAVVETIKSLVFPNAEHERQYNLISKTFYMLNYASSQKLEFFFLVFLLKTLDILGLSPQFDTCIKSGLPIETEEVLFSVEEGGIIAKERANQSNGYFKLDQGILKAIRETRKYEIDKLKGLNFSEQQTNVIRDILFAFLNYHTDCKPSFNSLDFLSKLDNY